MVNQTIHALLVEDNPGDTQPIHELVTEISSVRFTWEEVKRLSEAKDILRVAPFDLVLLDLFLPDSQGLDTFIRLYPHAICLPVVVISDLDDELLAIEAVKAGAQDYMIKGQVDGEVLVRLRYAIERKRIESALRARNQQLTLLTEQLWRKARLASSMDEMVVSLVRELNNPLAVVSGQLEELLTHFLLNDPKRATLQTIQAEIERMGVLVGNLLQDAVQNTGNQRSGAPDPLQDLHEHKVGGLYNDESLFFEALGAWVAGYLFKGPSVTRRGLNNYLKRMKKTRTTIYDLLAPRELEVVYLIAKGYANKEIAKQLSISVRTVERHTSSAMKKLGLQNRAELIAYAVREGVANGNDTK